MLAQDGHCFGSAGGRSPPYATVFGVALFATPVIRGVVLAGGTGSRLDPLTRVTNKHLLPVYDRPMVFLAVGALVSAGIEHVLIITGGLHPGDFLPLLGDGSQLGVRHLEYAYQEHAGGIADALRLAERFAENDPVCVMLGDNVFEYSIRGAVERFRRQGDGARFLLAEVEDPTQYGVARLANGKLIGIDEKPKDPPSRYAVTGCYLYDSRVFDHARGITPSARHELEITDVNNAYIAAGRAEHDVVRGYWADCGESFDSYLRAITLVATRGANKPEPAA